MGGMTSRRQGGMGRGSGMGDPGRGVAGREGKMGQRGHDGGYAPFLGWFSVGLGMAQFLAPRAMARLVGATADDDVETMMRMLGVRELACGAGILTREKPVGFLWGRVAGDVMDLGLLGAAMTAYPAKRNRAVAAAAAVAGIMALDAREALRAQGTVEAAAPKAVTGPFAVRKSITVGKPIEDVYLYWRDFQNLPNFMRHLKSVHVLSDERSRWQAEAPGGFRVEWDAELIEDRPGQLIAWRSVAGADVDNAGSVRFVTAPGGRGTEVHVEMQYRPPAGALGKAVAKIFGVAPDQQLQDDLRLFKEILETGEVLLSDGAGDGTHVKQRPAQPLPEGHPRTKERLGATAERAREVERAVSIPVHGGSAREGEPVPSPS